MSALKEQRLRQIKMMTTVDMRKMIRKNDVAKLWKQNREDLVKILDESDVSYGEISDNANKKQLERLKYFLSKTNITHEQLMAFARKYKGPK